MSRRRAPARRDAGYVAVLAAGAVAALVTCSTMVLVAASTRHAALRYRVEHAQAREIAVGTLQQTVRALETGAIALPAASTTLTIDRGIGSDGDTLDVGTVPVDVTLLGSTVPERRDHLPMPGGRVRIARVVGPDGDPRRVALAGREADLFDLEIDAWFRRARATLRARFLLDGSLVVRID